METKGARNRIRARVEQWHAKLEHLKAEKKGSTAEARRDYRKQLQELQATIAKEVQEWNATIDEYDADPNQTTQKEFEEKFGLPEIRKRINDELVAAKTETHDVD